MPEANPVPFPSNSKNRYPRIAPAQKPKVLGRLREALHSRHSFPTHPVEDGYDIRIIQKFLDHKEIGTIMIYAHVLNRDGQGVRSPADSL